MRKGGGLEEPPRRRRVMRVKSLRVGLSPWISTCGLNET
jgi:hypothetical protein